MNPKAPIRWTCRDRTLELGDRTLVMGILNVTPDSFSDGGRFFDPSLAVSHGLQMAADGADILDVGGESTRPGSDAVSVDEELRRTAPVIEALRKQTDCLLSIDTRKAAVARRALELGAHIVNDVSALTSDPVIAEVVREFRAGAILMHMRGEPRTMQADPQYGCVTAEVAGYLEERMAVLAEAGLAEESLAIDPGIGFGKLLEHNLALLAGLERLGQAGRPVVVGVSRKSFLGRITGRDVGERLVPSLAAAVYSVLRGAHVIRVHDVKESCDAMRVVDMLRREGCR